MKSTVLMTVLVMGNLTGAFQFDAAAQEKAKITVESPAFKNGEAIPLDYSAYGKNVSPPLTWSGLPERTKELVLICDDPDAPTPQPFVHWVVYNIPVTAKGLPQDLPKFEEITEPAELTGTIQGLTGIRRAGYFGPRPPNDGKVHHYHFKVYALDADVNLPKGLTKDSLLRAIQDHIIGEGELVGTYKNEE